jgi:hypothetical protein
LIKAPYLPGPLSLLRGEADETEIEWAAALTVRYGKGKDSGKVEVHLKRVGRDCHRIMTVSSAPEGKIKNWMIGE